MDFIDKLKISGKTHSVNPKRLRPLVARSEYKVNYILQALPISLGPAKRLLSFGNLPADEIASRSCVKVLCELLGVEPEEILLEFPE